MEEWDELPNNQTSYICFWSFAGSTAWAPFLTVTYGDSEPDTEPSEEPYTTTEEFEPETDAETAETSSFILPVGIAVVILGGIVTFIDSRKKRIAL